MRLNFLRRLRVRRRRHEGSCLVPGSLPQPGTRRRLAVRLSLGAQRPPGPIRPASASLGGMSLRDQKRSHGHAPRCETLASAVRRLYRAFDAWRAATGRAAARLGVSRWTWRACTAPEARRLRYTTPANRPAGSRDARRTSLVLSAAARADRSSKHRTRWTLVCRRST